MMEEIVEGYQAPRIVSHSAQSLHGLALAVHACTGFSPFRYDEDDEDDENDEDEAVLFLPATT